MGRSDSTCLIAEGPLQIVKVLLAPQGGLVNHAPIWQSSNWTGLKDVKAI